MNHDMVCSSFFSFFVCLEAAVQREKGLTPPHDKGLRLPQCYSTAAVPQVPHLDCHSKKLCVC